MFFVFFLFLEGRTKGKIISPALIRGAFCFFPSVGFAVSQGFRHRSLYLLCGCQLARINFTFLVFFSDLPKSWGAEVGFGKICAAENRSLCL